MGLVAHSHNPRYSELEAAGLQMRKKKSGEQWRLVGRNTPRLVALQLKSQSCCPAWEQTLTFLGKNHSCSLTVPVLGTILLGPANLAGPMDIVLYDVSGGPAT